MITAPGSDSAVQCRENFETSAISENKINHLTVPRLLMQILGCSRIENHEKCIQSHMVCSSPLLPSSTKRTNPGNSLLVPFHRHLRI